MRCEPHLFDDASDWERTLVAHVFVQLLEEGPRSPGTIARASVQAKAEVRRVLLALRTSGLTETQLAAITDLISLVHVHVNEKDSEK